MPEDQPQETQETNVAPVVEEDSDDEVPFDSSIVRPKFIPRGYEKLDKNIFRNIFYSTSNGDSYRAPGTHHNKGIGEALLLGSKSKSVQDIHDGARATFKPSRAPLYQRTMCAYTEQFVPRPLDGKMINKECYDLFKEKCESSNLSSAGPQAVFRGVTTTMASYPEYGKDESKKAIAPNFRPQVDVHVNKENKMLVTQSQGHKDFPCPSPEHTKTARPEAFKPKYKTHKAVGRMVSQSSYSRDYFPGKYDRLWPVKYKGMSGPPPAAAGYTGSMRMDPNGESKLVPEQFFIGDVVNYGPC